MIVHQDNGSGARQNSAPEHFAGVGKQGVQRSDGDKLMSLDVVPSVENEHRQTLALAVEVWICGDVQAPVFGCLLWRVAEVQLLGNRTLAQGDDLEFLGDVSFRPTPRQF